MLHLHAHGFVDGAYVRRLATDADQPLVNPYLLVANVLPSAQDWGSPATFAGALALTRVTYYDARPEGEADVDPVLRDYWDSVELLQDTHLGFGSVRGGTKRKAPRQKGVDTLIAVDMVVGAFTKIFPIAVLVAGDADFVPVVHEVQRRGVMVLLAAADGHAVDLRRAADRFVRIGMGPGLKGKDFPPLSVGEKTWRLGSANRGGSWAGKRDES